MVCVQLYVVHTHILLRVCIYSHANTPLSQSERGYYLSYFINNDNDKKVIQKVQEMWCQVHVYVNYLPEQLNTINNNYYLLAQPKIIVNYKSTCELPTRTTIL